VNLAEPVAPEEEVVGSGLAVTVVGWVGLHATAMMMTLISSTFFMCASFPHRYN
jgi:hypothetical protein